MRRNILQSLTSADEAHRQIAFADVILLNKCDLIDTHQLDAVPTSFWIYIRYQDF
ncbi:MAG: hypothetical protein IPL08_12860 [Saprospiraceae bacterium]|nr:hypothetical protein [Saprospiraceae bacterium]